ncbi:MAG TPA: 50S ribosomal protein L6 [Syntrophothermus lipocalidus]|uniref:Large ribosomal subunit protein uL6 n=1 Tax=Syntrophothermus lipocalidus (strain DSM 12680 / TGB-C1) TaxID=643648 RepID=D7CJK8_SYNLT|nr:50S ribosomal protein L6 [Syntrophothermus lipocalidus]ADI02963.1 ribosomal protein L6 [Syntrophothermus lipocalidus DSM 12680]HHV77840.1 50S ribosomal protein L6 [Syntrophothermus lipocalidus]HOV43120.1 50S ribosomal protein L6 [Syntrophothermus lipocalidus]
MSRIGKKPIEKPEGVTVTVQENTVSVQGPKGVLTLGIPAGIEVQVEDNQVLITRASDEKEHRALHGLTRALLANMVEGVTKGFEKRLDLVGVGYRAQVQGRKLVLSVGYSHPVEVDPPQGIEIEVPAPTKIVVKGIDKQQVGEMAARIRAIRRPEPYKGKGIKYENEVVRRKAGKAGGR